MKTLHTRFTAALCGVVIALSMLSCTTDQLKSFLGAPTTQPTTQPVALSPAQTTAVAIEAVSSALPIPWNAIGGVLGGLLGLASALYAQAKTGEYVPVALRVPPN